VNLVYSLSQRGKIKFVPPGTYLATAGNVSARLNSTTAEDEQHDYDNQDYTEDADSAAHAVLGVAVIAATETAEQKKQQDDN
jgi:hypothetical protein